MASERMPAGDKAGPLKVGGRFLKYSIQRLLGTGGHAWVYQGHDPFLDVEVAIKILHRPGGVTNDMLRRGQVEAKLLYRLKHEHIVNVLDAGITDDGLLYIVMELLHGDTLRRLLVRKGRLPLEEVLPLFAKITDGVEAAHAFGAIHRDLKPENIIVHHDGEPKVLDFGIAKVVDAAGWTTEKDVIHGTVLYMSPEQLHGEKATARSDVYALGLILFETLYGRHPLLLKNQRPTVQELTWMQLSMKPPRVDEIDSTIPRHVARLIERMILKVPAHRVASMKECGQVIRECIATLASESAGSPVLNVVTERIVDTERVAEPPFEPSITMPRNRPPAATLAVTDPLDPAPRSAGPDGNGVASAAFSEGAAQKPAASARPPTDRPVTTNTSPPRAAAIAGATDELPVGFMLRVLAASCVAGAALGGAYLFLTEPPPAPHADAMVASDPPARQDVAKVAPVAATLDAPPPPPPAPPNPPVTAVAVTEAPASPAKTSIRAPASATIATPKKARARASSEPAPENQLWVEARKDRHTPKPITSADRVDGTRAPWPTRPIRPSLE
jgi:eukaryotic-like serine/threonine-protein kinase